MPANITVEYNRVPDYPKERLSSQSIEVTDMLQCAWGDRITLAKELIGYTVGSILHPPHEYDFGEDNIPNIFCRDVSIEPIISHDDTGEYKVARLSVRYANLDYEETEEVYVTESLEPASEFLTLSHEGLYWDSGQEYALESTEAPAMIVRMIDWVYTVHHKTSIPNWVWTHPGTINSSSTYSKTLNESFGAETLLCGNPSLSREITSSGETAWTITVRLTYRKETWNKFPRVTADGDLAFISIYDGSGSKKEFYQKSNFGNIIL